MAEFCVCGSVKINGNCTNKNCKTLIPAAAAKAAKTAKAVRARTNKAAAAAAAVEKPAPKNTKVPRASKVVTYHISDLPLKDQPK